LLPKTIQELFDPLGRMNATLGVELPFTTTLKATTIPLGFVDPPTETTTAGETQLWKITHNGVDSHGIHFHLFNVQVVNRVGWDGAIRAVDPNEIGWKETVRMNPLEDIIIAAQAKKVLVPYGVPDSIRPLDTTLPLGASGTLAAGTGNFTGINPVDGTPLVVTNVMTNFGWEYTWHCHILGHEENDMMRVLSMTVPSTLPAASVLTAPTPTVIGAPVVLTWTDPTPAGTLTTYGNPANEIGFRSERAVVTGGVTGAYTAIGTTPANSATFTDTTPTAGTTYSYRVVAFNAAGETPSNAVTVIIPSPTPAAPSNLVATAIAPQPRVSLAWTDNSNNETGFTIQRARNTGFTTGLTTFAAAANATTLVDTSVAANTTYFYRVRANLGANFSAWSNTATVTTGAQAIAAPSNLRISIITRTSMRLRWTDNSNNEQGFQIWRSTTGVAGSFTQIAQVPANATQYTVNGLLPLTTYYFQVRAFNATATSAFTPVVLAETLP
jgi:hypothetical protein